MFKFSSPFFRTPPFPSRLLGQTLKFNAAIIAVQKLFQSWLKISRKNFPINYRQFLFSVEVKVHFRVVFLPFRLKIFTRGKFSLKPKANAGRNLWLNIYLLLHNKNFSINNGEDAESFLVPSLLPSSHSEKEKIHSRANLRPQFSSPSGIKPSK